MTPDAARETYRRLVDMGGEPIFIRRYTGTGTARPKFDYPVQARVVGFDSSGDLAATAREGNRTVILLAEDLRKAQFPLPIRPTDYAVVRKTQMAISAPDDSTIRIAGELIGYRLTVRAGD